jgi:hypothetical protein
LENPFLVVPKNSLNLVSKFTGNVHRASSATGFPQIGFGIAVTPPVSNSNVTQIAELPWTQISGELSSQFGQKENSPRMNIIGEPPPMAGNEEPVY